MGNVLNIVFADVEAFCEERCEDFDFLKLIPLDASAIVEDKDQVEGFRRAVRRRLGCNADGQLAEQHQAEEQLVHVTLDVFFCS